MGRAFYFLTCGIFYGKTYIMSKSQKSKVLPTLDTKYLMPDQSSKWFSPIRGDEHILLGRDSPLRRIPVNVSPKKAVFLDGIRHAIEVMDIGFGRLRLGLTQAALEPPQSSDLPLVGAGLFLDAWAVVDAIDKFRQFYLRFPGMTPSVTHDQVLPLHEVLQVFRDLRNVGDHVVDRVDAVVASGGAALGELTWLTGAQLVPEVVAWQCVLRPGTLRSRPMLPTVSTETALDWPTDYICLKAGGLQGDLSQVRIHIAARIRHLESQLHKAFSKPEYDRVPVFNDYFNRSPVHPKSVERDAQDSV